jgi:hypothetical protein
MKLIACQLCNFNKFCTYSKGEGRRGRETKKAKRQKKAKEKTKKIEVEDRKVVFVAGLYWFSIGHWTVGYTQEAILYM